MKRKHIYTFAITAFAIAAMAAEGSAAMILQPTTASTGMGELFPASRTRNQSGLSIGYTSLVTDFDAYIASGPTAFHGAGSNI